MTIQEKSLKKHYQWKGKLEIHTKIDIKNVDDLSLAYTPGVASACLEIEKDYNKSFDLTWRHNCVAVITDGTAVLGLGDIGPEAGMPVMEGKCALLKNFANVDAIPICIRSKDIDEIVKTVYNISGSFGGINLEDISAPRCFEVERRLKEICDIPVFHDDQHGTAIVVGAAMINAIKFLKKDISSIKVVINGAGAAGIAIANHLMKLGVVNLVLVDISGAICDGDKTLSVVHTDMAKKTNPNKENGSLKDVIQGADVFVGVSVGKILSKEMVSTMNKDAVVFAMANPTPEITPEEALAGGARIVGTGRSDYDNQINNLLAFPGIFRGALDCRAKEISEKMMIEATYAIANIVEDHELCEKYIIPSVFNPRVVDVVAEAVKREYLNKSL